MEVYREEVSHKDDILACLKYYHPPGSTFEVRLHGIKAHNSSLWANEWAAKGVSGYFNDHQVAADAIIKAEQEVNPDLVMVSVNSCPDDYLALANNRFRVKCPALKDSDIKVVSALVVDFDPVKAVKGASATDSEKEKAYQQAMKFVEDLVAGGMPEPMVTDSGNGIHVTLKLPDLPVAEGRGIVKDFTEFISSHYSIESTVIVDTSMATPAHPVKVAGVKAMKGEDMPDRPHRRSKIISFPQKIDAVPRDRLIAIATQYRNSISDQRQEQQTIKSPALTNANKFDVAAYLAHYNKQVVKTVQYGDATLHVLDCCLFDPTHKTRESAIGQRSDGTLFTQCFHETCNHRWEEARRLISGNDSLEQFMPKENPGFQQMVGTVVSMQDLVATDFPPVIPLIQDIIGVGEACVLSGPGGVGKSNLALNLALSLGSPGFGQFLGLSVADQVNTLIVQAENAASDTKTRLQLMANYPGFQPGLSHVFSPTHNQRDIRILGCDINDDKFLQRLKEDIAATNAGLLIIDPLISFHHGEENDNSGMRRTLDRLTKIIADENIAILLVHHVGKVSGSANSAYAGRGASAVGDWTHNSFLLRVSDPKNDVLELSCQKARNFKKPNPVNLKLNQHLVFERFYPQGGFSQALQNRLVTDALLHIGGTATSQKQLIGSIIQNNPSVNATKVHEIIKDAVARGSIVEGQSGRKKTYHLPQQQSIGVGNSQPITPVP